MKTSVIVFWIACKFKSLTKKLNLFFFYQNDLIHDFNSLRRRRGAARGRFGSSIFFSLFLKAKDFLLLLLHWWEFFNQQHITPAGFFSEAGIGTNRYSASIFFTELSNRFKLPHFLPFYGELHCCKHFLRKSSFFLQHSDQGKSTGQFY